MSTGNSVASGGRQLNKQEERRDRVPLATHNLADPSAEVKSFSSRPGWEVSITPNRFSSLAGMAN
jgi:hypothetical protein